MYAKCGCMENACLLFDRLPRRDLIAWNAMIHGYLRHRLISNAYELFTEMPQRDVSWFTMISGYSQSGFHTDALKLYLDMRIVGVEVNEITIVSVLSSRPKLQEFKEGEKVHAHMIKSGLKGLDAKLKNGVVYLYAGCRRMDCALELFREPDQDVVAWCALIVGFARSGFVDFSRRLFDKMPHRDAIAWGTMISSYTNGERLNEALNLFKELECSQIEPEEASMVSLCTACARLASLEQATKVHNYIKKTKISPSSNPSTALIDMYVKCGNIEYALKLFQSLNDNKNVSIWNAMIGGLAMNGRSKEALGLFSEMERTNIKPDEITFVGVLSACRHGGLIDEAWHIYDKMNRVYGIEPGFEHYGCMVDLISRLGRLSEAEDLTAKMTIRPQVSTWGALLAACKIHGDVKLGERVPKHLLKLDLNHVGCKVMLSNLFAEAGFWDKVAEVRRGMKSLSTTPGWSLIEVE
ncbi:hypothetical protein AMTRI_Chr06g179030 [Amborella trichopoda]|uniref:pentatricopeptide repeat-containing protein At5g19020, mitochondrial-like n=1 Tax=Amborella trichopoda TaxID=13333 RepID=UPI0005D435A7|nr:pentatricopeptide repeat-containing protein At5g19020, mitochondrial-like [Amborella trichopoda]|eukprot:XP_011628763.1 pentatricopeptide repeat-containing protein At5g19020, mitochondrial-like [Amborella trichopoda]